MDFRHVETGTEFGLEAQQLFTSARLLLADASAAARMLKLGIGKTTGKFELTPTIVFRTMDMVDGGLSEVEEASYLKFGYEAGARDVMVLTGAELSNPHLREIMKVRRKASRQDLRPLGYRRQNLPMHNSLPEFCRIQRCTVLHGTANRNRRPAPID